MVCAIIAVSSTIAAWRCRSPINSHNAAAGAALSANSRRNCTIGPPTACPGIIALGQDDTLEQRVKNPSRGEQIIKRRQRPRPGRVGRDLQIGPRRRDEQVASVRQHHNQLQAPAAPHPPHQLKRAALPRVPRPPNPDRRREAIEVGSVSCLPSTASPTTTF
jgi:hypothetical protein